jgi:hypothetical protein
MEQSLEFQMQNVNTLLFTANPAQCDHPITQSELRRHAKHQRHLIEGWPVKAKNPPHLRLSE